MIDPMEEKLTKAQLKEQRKQERQEWEQKMEKEAKTGNAKRIGLWLGGALIVVLVLWGLVALFSTPTPSSQDLALTAPQVSDIDLSFGPKDAKATLIEYADFQCPGCRAQHPMVNQVLKEYNGKIRFIYRFFPLPQIHQNAIVAADAGYAAYLQGKFPEMSDLLFSNQPDWATLSNDKAKETFVAYAKQLSMDTQKFQADMDNPSTLSFIQKEENAGEGAGVNGTPTFFVNGKSIPIPQSYDDYKQAINSALNAK